MIAIFKATMHRTRRHSVAAVLFLSFSVLALLIQAVSLFRRGSREESDVSVFYRATQLLQDGIGGELYTMRDAKYDWPIPIPPAGLSFFQPLASLSPALSTFLWALFNLALIAAAAVFMSRYFASLDKAKRVHLQVMPYAVGIFLLLASGSLQVGQFSSFFVACWIFGLYACIKGRNLLAGIFLALPAAIKVYPALILAAPLALSRTPHAAMRVLGFFVVGFALSCFLLPTLFYQSRTVELTTSWWKNVIFSQKSRMSEMQDLGSPNNQSLDTVLLRYFTHDKKFHKKNPHIPHLNLDSQDVLTAANVVRLAILLITIGAAVLWRRRVLGASPYNLLVMAALWSATLYLILPETKARYAVITALAFIPLLVPAYLAKWQGHRLAFALRCLFIAVCFVLTLSLLPGSLRVTGIGFFGPLLLWCGNLHALLAPRRISFPEETNVMLQPAPPREIVRTG